MEPPPGARVVRFVGDRVRFTVQDGSRRSRWRAVLRTNLGRAAAVRREIIAAHAGGPVPAGASWCDLPMHPADEAWEIELPLAETGFFKAKAYLLDPKGWQYWPEGPDIGISVHPDFARTANTIYCAFTRLFGSSRHSPATRDAGLVAQLQQLDEKDFTVIPPSGTLRDLTRQLPHITQKLGCRILHLLPVHPTPTTFARFGRFGSPYAALDLTAIDPALVEFDRRTTGVDQFGELTRTAHAFGARVFLDIVINHTGWGSVLQESHPEFFLRHPDGTFASPGAWGTTWEDLVELKQEDVRLWDKIAEALLIWCRRGVDGFRCDAGYKIPLPAWQYITARVRDEFPETIFLLEGLGGSWEVTEDLLTEGGMHWAYSELFQNYTGRQVADYLDYANRQNTRIGTYIHYSETHDNHRLAARGRAWSLLRNRLCGLTSASGGFGFTGGVEWLAAEKINVHGCAGLAWDNPDNLVPELARLNQLLADHPCFFDGAKLTRLSPSDSPVYALLRESAEGSDSVLVLANTDIEKKNTVTVPASALRPSLTAFELLGQQPPKFTASKDEVTFALEPGACCCLAPTERPVGLSGEAYRRRRAQAAWAMAALSKMLPVELIGCSDWRWLAAAVERSPALFLAAACEWAARRPQVSLADVLNDFHRRNIFPRVVVWTLLDQRRVTPVPPGHWVLIQDSGAFRATLRLQNESEPTIHVQSIGAADGHVACFPPRETPADATLTLDRCATASPQIAAAIRFLSPHPPAAICHPQSDDLVLLTNGIGGMARLGVDLGRVHSKYDCALGANLHPSVPVDRHVFVKRLRVWVNADGFLSSLDFKNLASFAAGPPAVWQFVANAGDGRTVEVALRATMIEGKNTAVFRFSRPTAERAIGKQLPPDADVRLTVRCDIEDRNFHWETHRNGGAEHHFSAHTLPLPGQAGFAFTPAPDRQLRVFADAGEYHPQPEWCENIPHPVEQSRGQVGSGDAYSPGWFELPLPQGAEATLVLTAEGEADFDLTRPVEVRSQPKAEARSGVAETGSSFEARLIAAAKQFVVRRDGGKTVIAGYPWFLDWGRDSLICARGLLAAGLADEVEQLLLTFARFERDGTLPNSIQGEDASNRDTSDAPLWFALACEDLARATNQNFYSAPADPTRTVFEVLRSIAANYAKGTPNGIRMDADSALIWSPAHFTWMDTNYPAGTPREGYPVEIQALWIRLLRQLQRISAGEESKQWGGLADQATASLETFFWCEESGWLADVLLAKPSVAAAAAKKDDALRSNGLFMVSLGLLSGDRAKRCVEAARRYLAVPGAMRSLAPLPVSVPLAIHGNDGRLLNNPVEPYWPRYAGDEDTRRKPAYHNGTAWTWTLPTFGEALARAWDLAPEAVAAAKAYLGSMESLMCSGCLGQVPEILDGDAPHAQRGCDAQAWGATEALRVWKWLNSPEARAK
ncbi:MAG TPA: amylo-alpha-1,6-glucosidase [Candidatus Acidoferrum sp.]|nr:amylo-alpha-1,6-glucosidase [Candidatus Acidoferrum sp.]